jgi:Type II site-specific deoxyribonuclease
MTDARRNALHGKVDALGDPEVVVVDHFVDAVLTPVDYELTGTSWLTVQPWAEAFLARLRAHHALNPEPLSTTAFESAFNASCKAAGWRVLPSSSATNRFFDTVLMVPGRGRMQISLKATAARDIREEWVHISKLTEAAWIQDTRREADHRAKLVELLTDYRRETDSIVMLRCFRDGGEAVLLYELVEIPTTIFDSVDDLTTGQAQARTIPLPPAASDPIAKIRVDRSDAKITITGIRIEVCTVHGRWAIPSNLADEEGPA